MMKGTHRSEKYKIRTTSLDAIGMSFSKRDDARYGTATTLKFECLVQSLVKLICEHLMFLFLGENDFQWRVVEMYYTCTQQYKKVPRNQKI